MKVWITIDMDDGFVYSVAVNKDKPVDAETLDDEGQFGKTTFLVDLDLKALDLKKCGCASK